MCKIVYSKYVCMAVFIPFYFLFYILDEICNKFVIE